MPLVARYSSGTPMNRMTPRVAGTLRDSAMKICIKAAFLLFVVGSTWLGRALMVIL